MYKNVAVNRHALNRLVVSLFKLFSLWSRQLLQNLGRRETLQLLLFMKIPYQMLKRNTCSIFQESFFVCGWRRGGLVPLRAAADVRISAPGASRSAARPAAGHQTGCRVGRDRTPPLALPHPLPTYRPPDRRAAAMQRRQWLLLAAALAVQLTVAQAQG